MSVVMTLSNLWKYQQGAKLIDIQNDTFKIILMNDTFVFNPDTHGTLADVIASPNYEVATGNGYTQQNKELTGGTWAQDDTNNRGARSFDTPTWTAVGGAIGPIGCAIVYDNTTGSTSPVVSPTVVGCIDFGEEINMAVGYSLKVEGIVISSR